MFGRMKVPPQLARITMKDVLDQPELKAIADRLAADALTSRKALVAQLAQFSEERADAKCAAAMKALAEAEAKATAAKAAFDDAREKRNAAAGAYASISMRIGTNRQILERELVATADPRLAHFIAALEDLWERARQSVTTELRLPSGPGAAEKNASLAKRLKTATQRELDHFRGAGWLGSAEEAPPETLTRLASNYSMIEDVLAKVRSVSDEVRAAQLEALDADEVAASLEAWCDALRPALAAVGLFPPSLLDDDFSRAAA